MMFIAASISNIFDVSGTRAAEDAAVLVHAYENRIVVESGREGNTSYEDNSNLHS